MCVGDLGARDIDMSTSACSRANIDLQHYMTSARWKRQTYMFPGLTAVLRSKPLCPEVPEFVVVCAHMVLFKQLTGTGSPLE